MFTTTLREAILFPFNKETGELCYVTNEDEVHIPTMKFYIIYAQHSILTQNTIVDNTKYLSFHPRYRFCKAHLLHKYVPMTIVSKLAR